MVLIDLQKVLGTLGLVSSVAKPPHSISPLQSSIIGATTNLVAALDVNATDAMGWDPCAMTPYNPAPVYLESFEPYDANKALLYRYRQQQSVNLGSWFVQEQWMNPSLFACAAGAKQAELDVASGWTNVDIARQVLERHWDTWITEDDFRYLASIGINTVRLPLGYWSLGPIYCQGTAFESVSAVYVNSWARVVRAINWAQKYGLGVLVDLHGAPGSQNGQGHSGTSDGQQTLFDNPNNIQLTLNALTFLTQQLVKVNNVVGIQILNEPSNVDSLPSFYSQMLTTLRKVSPEAYSFPFYIHDAFDMSRFADYISTRSDFVVLDHHSYFVFGDEASRHTPASQLSFDLRPGHGSLAGQIHAAAVEGRRNIVIDEYSCALAEAALVNSSDPAFDRQQFCTGQLESYANSTAGWSFWSYKTEGCNGDENWCFKSAVGKSLPSSFHSYPARDGPRARSLLPATSSHQHRFAAPQERRQEYLSTSDNARQKGYADGKRAALTFASDGSKLGFTGQFMNDALSALGSSIMSTDAQSYRQGFLGGLADGEREHMQSS